MNDTRADLRRGFVGAVLVSAMAVSLARALRLPNDFSEIHWLLDYRFGFIKRGFIGSLCSLVTSLADVAMGPGIIIALATLSFLGLYGALLLVLFRMQHRVSEQRDFRLMALVFATSPFIVMNAHLFGYFDALLYTGTIIAVALVLSNRPFSAAMVSVVALLTHESYLLVGYPLVCLAALLHYTGPDYTGNKFRHYGALGLPLLTFAAIILAQSLFIDLDALRPQLTDYLVSFDFLPTRGAAVAQWQTTGFFEFFEQQRQHLAKRLLNPGLLATYGPPLLAILYFIHATYRIRPFGILSLAIFAAVACPLAMHAIAWDTSRISSYVVGGAFIAAWIVVETRKSARGDDLFPLIAVPVIVLNIFARTPLMDGELDRFSNLGRGILYAPVLALMLYVVAKGSATRPSGRPRDGVAEDTSA